MDQVLVATLTKWRHHLHAHPELSAREEGTSRFVQARLAAWDIPFTAGIGGHGIVATLRRDGSHRSVGLRADMDALAITEETGHAYRSTTPGVMHACGHDGHTIALLGAAALLQSDEHWRGAVHFVFQPAEENGVGARRMIADGLFERFSMERIFAFHNMPGLAAGILAIRDGPMMAQGGRLVIEITGHAAHAAMPHLARDPIVAAAHLVTALQTVVARNVDPIEAAVVSIGAINGGVMGTQIPDKVVLSGTIRTFRPGQRQEILDRIQAICHGIALMFGVAITMDGASTGMVTLNSKDEAAMAADAGAAAGMVVRWDVPPSLASEDFAAYLTQRPGAMAWIGNGLTGPGGVLHNASYDFNDAILPIAATWFAAVAKRALQDKTTR